MPSSALTASYWAAPTPSGSRVILPIAIIRLLELGTPATYSRSRSRVPAPSSPVNGRGSRDDLVELALIGHSSRIPISAMVAWSRASAKASQKLGHSSRDCVARPRVRDLNLTPNNRLFLEHRPQMS